MKSLRWIAIIFGGVLGLGILCFLLFSPNHSYRNVENEAASAKLTDDSSNALESEDYRDIVSPEEEALRPSDIDKGTWAWVVSDLRVKRTLNGEVNFYGKVLDSNGTPIAATRIRAEMFYYETSLTSLLNGSEKTREEVINIETDGEGKFEVVRPVGSSLTLMNFQREGFEKVGRAYHVFDFDSNPGPPHVGDPENPEVFTMKRVE